MERNEAKNNFLSNPETGWDSSKEKILEDIYDIEQKIKEVQRQKQENIDIMRSAEPLDDPHMQGIFEERFEYEMRRLDDLEYQLDIELSGLKFQLSQLNGEK